MDCNFGGPEESAAFGADLHAVYVDYFIPRSESTSDLSEVGSEALSERDENESESRSSRSRPSLVVFGQKEDELEETEVHLAHAKAERHYYRKQVKESRKIWKAFSDDSDMKSFKANTRPFSMHISFDHAQQVQIPV